MTEPKRLRIISKGTPQSTKVLFGDEALEGVISVKLDEITCDSGPVVVTLRCYVNEVDVTVPAEEVALEVQRSLLGGKVVTLKVKGEVDEQE